MALLRLFIFTLLLFSGLVLQAQSNFAPLGAFWNYQYTSHSGGYEEYMTILVTHDTIINGYETRYLTKYYNNYYALPPNPAPHKGTYFFGYLQLRGDSVFYLYSIGSEPVFLFHFDLSPGDTMQVSDSYLTTVVDTAFNIKIDSQTRMAWGLSVYCDTTFWHNATLIKNIGPVDDYLLWNKDGCVIGGGTWKFQCYHDSSITVNAPCTRVYTYADAFPVLSNRVQVYPVPAKDFIYINSTEPLHNVRLYFYDINASPVFFKEFEYLVQERLDLSHLPAGHYQIRIMSKDQTFFPQKIILIP